MVLLPITTRQRVIIENLCDEQIQEFLALEPRDTQRFLENTCRIKAHLSIIQQKIEESIAEFDYLKYNPERLYFINRHNIALVKHKLATMQGRDEFDKILYSHEFGNLWGQIGKVERLSNKKLLPQFYN